MTTNEDAKTHINKLIEKSAQAEKSEDAMRFGQAAYNAANALITIANLT